MVGFNIDENDLVAGVFWTQSKYSLEKLGEFVGEVASSTEPHHLVADYQAFKENYLLPSPTIFNDFGDIADWHSHENAVFHNLGTLNPHDVQFTQSLFDHNFVNSIANALADNTIVATPFEQDVTLGYPYFNSLIAPGFYMIHLWLGRENPAGLFANTHPEVAPDAIEEHLTFEDTSGEGHHGGDNDGDGSSPQSVPEPSLIGSMIGLGLIGITSLRFKQQNGHKSLIKR